MIGLLVDQPTYKKLLKTPIRRRGKEGDTKVKTRCQDLKAMTS